MSSMDGMDSLPAGESTGQPDASGAPERRQQPIAAEAGEAEEFPGLGALNRQLTRLTEELGTVHRLIGRVAAERDALRQQLADLQGVPFEDIVIPSVGASKEE